MEEQVRTDVSDLAEFGYKQELHRTLGSFSSFAAGYSYISILTGMFQTSYLGFFFAGPAFMWAWLFVMFGQFMVALQFAELSAHYPLAGSVYQWSKQLASQGLGVEHRVDVPVRPDHHGARGGAGVAGDPAADLDPASRSSRVARDNCPVNSRTASRLRQERDHAGHRHGRASRPSSMPRACSVLARINNIGVDRRAGRRGGPDHPVPDPRQPLAGEVLTNTANTANVPVHHAWGYLGALLVGAIMPLYVMYGFDIAGSLAEETDDPRRKAPRAVLQALATAGTMGFLLILFGTMAVSDALYKDPTSLGLAVITTDVLGDSGASVPGGRARWRSSSAASRSTPCRCGSCLRWAGTTTCPGGSRTGRVSGMRRVPVFPAVLVGAIAIAILAFNIHNPYAFRSSSRLGIIFMYLAYLGVTIPLLQRRRLRGGPATCTTGKKGLFSLGRWARRDERHRDRSTASRWRSTWRGRVTTTTAPSGTSSTGRSWAVGAGRGRRPGALLRLPAGQRGGAARAPRGEYCRSHGGGHSTADPRRTVI